MEKCPVLIFSVVFVGLVVMCSPSAAVVIDSTRTDGWTPQPPSAEDSFDWIELKSGEWLKGYIQYMQKEELEFDSEELDVRLWDWENLRSVRSQRLLTMRLRDDQVIVGSLLVTRDSIQVINSSGRYTYPRSELLSITSAGSSIIAGWALDVSIGLTTRAGNTNESNTNVHMELNHYTPNTRQHLEFLGNYGKLDSTVTKDDQRWSLYSDFFLTPQLFIRAPDLEYYHDVLQNLNYRITIGGSAGYDLINTPITEWQLTFGPAFQQNSYGTTEAGSNEVEKTLTWVLASQFEIELTKKLDFNMDYRGQLTKRGAGNNVHHLMATLEFEIHKLLELDLSFVWDRVTDPETDENGITPKPDDYQFITSLGITL
jgi:putative salt-induced outer membrane protein YdiY